MHRLLIDSAAVTPSPQLADSSWKALPPLPDPQGFAGSFAGVSADALLVAGGANFPTAPFWDGGTKVWSNQIFVLEDPQGQWKTVGKLPGPRGYGVSITTAEGLLCIGGNDAQNHHSDCVLLVWKNGTLEMRDFPSLPLPLADMTGALVGTTIHLVGGCRAPGASQAETIHLSFDLATPEQGWTRMDFPGPARILAVAAVCDDSFFVLSGASLAAGPDGSPVRTYLRDAWCHHPESGWKAIASLPRAVVAAPSPAPAFDPHTFFIPGGDDGSCAGFQPISSHPGFPRSVLAFDTRTGKWTELTDIPADFPAALTTPTTLWRDAVVIPSGEIRPAVRTPSISMIQRADEPTDPCAATL